MAATASERERVLNSLRSIELMLDDLSAVASEWDTLSDGERESWSHDWDNEIAGLAQLTGSVSQDALADGGLERYALVLRKLREAAPIVRRLNLRLPSERAP